MGQTVYLHSLRFSLLSKLSCQRYYLKPACGGQLTYL